MKKVGIVANQKKPRAIKLLAEIRHWLLKREVMVADNLSQSIDQVTQNAALIICLGGDGTMLSVASHVKEKAVPIMGVNLGRLGFLTEVKENEIYEELTAFFSGMILVSKTAGSTTLFVTWFFASLFVYVLTTTFVVNHYHRKGYHLEE